MEYVNVQSTKIPKIGLGTWTLKGQECVDAVKQALDIGYRHIDTAQNYGNEKEVGEAIHNSSVPREDIFLATKVCMADIQSGKVIEACKKSLGELNVDYLDLLSLHTPLFEGDIKPLMRDLKTLKDEGLIRNIGISNFNSKRVDEALESGVSVLSNQVEYHPFVSQDTLLKSCDEHNMALVAFAPLARGRVLESDLLQGIAKKYNKTPSQVALRWLTQQNNTIAIPKSVNPERLKENIDVFDFKLTEEEMNNIKSLRDDTRVCDFEWGDFD